MLAFQTRTSAQTLIHYWNFNNYFHTDYTDTIHAIAADYSLHDTSLAKIIYAKQPGVSALYTTYCDSVTPVASDSDIYNAQFSAPAGLTFRARNPSDSMELLFYIPTLHYHNINLAFEMERTTSGAAIENYDYSLDSGATFINTGLSQTSDSIPVLHIFRLISINFPETAANNSKLVFRIRYANGASATSGNHRYDNVTVMGDSITSTLEVYSNLTQREPAYTLHPNPASEHIIIDAPTDGDRTIMVVNEIGQSVYTGTSTGKHFGISTANFASGNYYITVRESKKGSEHTMKFIKQ